MIGVMKNRYHVYVLENGNITKLGSVGNPEIALRVALGVAERERKSVLVYSGSGFSKEIYPTVH